MKPISPAERGMGGPIEEASHRGSSCASAQAGTCILEWAGSLQTLTALVLAVGTCCPSQTQASSGPLLPATGRCQAFNSHCSGMGTARCHSELTW